MPLKTGRDCVLEAPHSLPRLGRRGCSEVVVGWLDLSGSGPSSCQFLLLRALLLLEVLKAAWYEQKLCLNGLEAGRPWPEAVAFGRPGHALNACTIPWTRVHHGTLLCI